MFVVEHHLDVVRSADWLVDVGPQAGEHGGRVLHSGPVAELARRRGVGDGAASCSTAPPRPYAASARAAARLAEGRPGHPAQPARA